MKTNTMVLATIAIVLGGIIVLELGSKGFMLLCGICIAAVIIDALIYLITKKGAK